MKTEQSSSNKKPKPNQKELDNLKAEVMRARLQNMANLHAKQLAILLKLALKGEKLKGKK